MLMGIRKFLLIGCLFLLLIGVVGIYYNLPQETLTIIPLEPIKLPAIVIP